jgi:hypothetical protein
VSTFQKRAFPRTELPWLKGERFISSTERQHLLTLSHLIFSFEPGFIASFQGEAVRSVMLARFLSPFSRFGGSLSFLKSGAGRPLQIDVHYFDGFLIISFSPEGKVTGW